MKELAPLKVSLHGMDERAMKMFEMFLAGPARGCCVVVPEGQQEAVVVDLDGIGADRLWLDVRRRFSGPALVLSVREKQLRHSIWLAKPVRADELISAVARIRTELLTLASLQRHEARIERTFKETLSAPPTVKAEPLPTAKSAPSLKPVVEPGKREGWQNLLKDKPPVREEGKAARAAELTLQERRVHECCGDLTDEVYRDPRRHGDLFFQPEDTLLGAMQEALQAAQAAGSPAAIEGLGQQLIVCPSRHRIFSEMREPYLRPLCVRSRRQTPMRIRILPLEETPLTASADPRLQRLDAVLWNIALWTSRGRIPQGFSIDAPVSLHAWPNFTRLQITPGAMQIAAIWIKHPTGLRATAERLGLPYRYVFSFFTACLALGLAEQTAISATAGPLSSPAPAAASAEKRGLLRRMLHKLGLG